MTSHSRRASTAASLKASGEQGEEIVRPSRLMIKGPENSFLLTTRPPFPKPTRQILSFELSLKGIEPPFSNNLSEELDYLCKSFGLLEPLGKEKTASLVFKELYNSSRIEKGHHGMLSSSELAKRLGISRGAVINQLNNLQRSGLVVKRGRQYAVRSNSILRTIEELESDVDKVFEKAKKVARKIDEDVGIMQ